MEEGVNLFGVLGSLLPDLEEEGLGGWVLPWKPHLRDGREGGSSAGSKSGLRD